jgi:ParB-like chromosome segregation protein Spo0J
MPNQLKPSIAHAELREIDSLKSRRNARRHDKRQLNLICKSMTEFGWTTPVLIDEESVVLAGYGRVEAARILGLTHAPVMVARGWSEAQKKAYMLADNQIALQAGWDEAILRLELEELQLMQFDVELIGFPNHELTNLRNFGSLERPVGNLRDQFVLPPFSILDSKQGWWQERRRAWLALGIQSELGRGDNVLRYSDTIRQPDPAKRAKETNDLRGGLTHRVTTDAYRKYGEPL